MGIHLVDTVEALVNLLNEWSTVPLPTAIAVDLEGVSLGRHGRACIMQLFAQGSNEVYLIDLTILGRSAFDISNDSGRSLRSLLEDNKTRKVFWDVRHDSDALFSHFNVSLRGCYDLQILEVAVRHSQLLRTKFVRGLGKSMQDYGLASAQWTRDKDQGVKLFAPEHGGSYSVFEKRPLDPRIIKYCAQDVSLMFQLEAAMHRKVMRVIPRMEEIIVRETAARIQQSQGPHYPVKDNSFALANIVWR